MAINIKGKPPASKPSSQETVQTTVAPTTETDLGALGDSGQTPNTPDQGTPQEGGSSAPGGNSPQDHATPPQTPPQTAPGHQSGASFLMSGNQQKSQIDQVKTLQDMRSKLRNGAFPFYLNPGEFAKLYFLDGTVLSDGVFDTPMIATHTIQIGGNFSSFVCNMRTEGSCVVCDSNAEGTQPSSLQLFTVINIMPYTIQKGPRKGTVLPARLQLFPATMKVREKLMKRAQNRGGTLAGSIYQFSRGSKQDPRTGEDIEYVQDVPMASVLAKYPMLGSTRNAKGDYIDAPTAVYDYAKVYPVLTNAELAMLRPDLASMAGFSTAHAPAQNYGPATGFGQVPGAAIEDDLPF